MKDKELSFDRNKHILYSKRAKILIINKISEKYGPDETNAIWEKTQKIYINFINSMPYMGGRKNYQSRGVYDSVALFAFYEAMPEKPGLQELEQMNNELFVPGMARLSFINMNWKWPRKLAHMIFTHLAKKTKKQEQCWPGNYHMYCEPYDEEGGIYYEFTTCPIADFARRNGYTHLMPAMCNADYPMLKAMHAALIRGSTCANGGCCDYRIVGDESRLARKHPVKRDEEGYLYNEL